MGKLSRGARFLLCTEGTPIVTVRPLQRVLGQPTAWLVGIGVAIGSGIFRTPGDVAGTLGSPAAIIVAWLLGGVVVTIQGLVTAELGTRFGRAGGEYVFLKEAYGDFVAFFFGWAYTLFIIGGGLATIAAAFGDFACKLFALPGAGASGWFGAAAVGFVVLVNLAGLRTGAVVQNLLTLLKLAAMAAIVVAGFGWGTQDLIAAPVSNPTGGGGAASLLLALPAALLPILWSYDGATDSVKLAEEVRDVRRALPRALVGAAALLTVVYGLVNLALLRVLPATDLAASESAPAAAMTALFGEAGGRAMLIVAMIVCLGALSSTLLATIRVTFALARDGLAPRWLARMSKSQAPAPALLLAAGFAILLVLQRSFQQVLGIYFFASAILFGLSYASLIVFRRREEAFPQHAFRCPAGELCAVLLIALHLALAAHIAADQPTDALWSLVLLAAIGVSYAAWRRSAALRGRR
ncbi:MAG: amino acid permease [Planctomycetota bacterium]|nr:MAG: amino acid permease [Planctomycetota bacterium]